MSLDIKGDVIYMSDSAWILELWCQTDGTLGHINLGWTK